MLSQQIASVSQTSALLQSSIISSIAILRSYGSLPRRSRPRHQIRTLRIGLWSSHLDPEFQKEVQRRNRIMKHKFVEAMNRRLSWERDPPRHIGLKSFMCSAWRGQVPRMGGRWADIDESNTASSDRPKESGGIEEVEQSALDNLMDHNNAIYEKVLAGTARSRNWFMASEGTKNTGSTSSKTPAQPRRSQDPFTDIFSRDESSQRLESEPEYYIDPITNRKVAGKDSGLSRKPIDVPVKTLKGYRSQFQDFAPPSPERTESEYKTYKPLSVSEGSPEVNSIMDTEHRGDRIYKTNFRYGSSGRTLESVAENLKEFDSQTSYETTDWYPENELQSESEKPCPVEEGLSDYDSKVNYGPFMAREPDGKLHEKLCPVQQGLQDYDSKVKYGPVMHNEPDGQPAAERDPVAEGLKDYDDKANYGPVAWNEPIGQPPAEQDPVAEALREFDERGGYGPRRIWKNISLTRSTSTTDKSFRYAEKEMREDLDLLRLSGILAASGVIKGGKKETKAEKDAIRSELEKDFQREQDLMEKLSIETSELRNDTAHLQGKVESQLGKAESTESSQRKLTGNFGRDFPGEFETKWTPETASGSLKLDANMSEPQKSFPQESYSRSSDVSRIQPSLDRSINPSTSLKTKQTSEELEIERDPYSKELQGLETSFAREVKLQYEKDPYSMKPMGLETSFAEEIASQQAEGDLSARVASFGRRDTAAENLQAREANKLLNETRDQHKKLVQEIRQIYEDQYGTIDGKHRQVTDSVASVRTPEARTIQAQEPILESIAPEAQEPTIYKILAYNPTMQEINTAETTSIVPDSASALTPAEVLLRISNPAKFFPHFQPLQSQGYEIVSGSGDVLVFRKVRAAGLSGSENESTSSIQERRNVSTNPIDGMQSPMAATGNFASPTGFVNHDLPVEEPRFKSNIDVRREEPVFSGKPNWRDESRGSKRKGSGRGKRFLLGAAWVAGCSYAIGVVAEFFRTGGMDGLGSKTF